MAKKKTVKKTSKKVSHVKQSDDSKKVLAIVGLVINLILFPGLGSIIGGKTREGIWQIVLLLIGIALFIVLIGIPIIIAAWIWALVTGIRMVQEAY